MGLDGIFKLRSCEFSMSVSFDDDGTQWCSEPALVWDQLRQAWAEVARGIQSGEELGNEVSGV